MESDDRLACTATLQVIFETLIKHIAPILPHLVEEAFTFYPLSNNYFYNFICYYSEKYHINFLRKYYFFQIICNKSCRNCNSGSRKYEACHRKCSYN